MSPSSSGPGLRIFIPATGVRFPLGTLQKSRRKNSSAFLFIYCNCSVICCIDVILNPDRNYRDEESLMTNENCRVKVEILQSSPVSESLRMTIVTSLNSYLMFLISYFFPSINFSYRLMGFILSLFVPFFKIYGN